MSEQVVSLPESMDQIRGAGNYKTARFVVGIAFAFQILVTLLVTMYFWDLAYKYKGYEDSFTTQHLISIVGFIIILLLVAFHQFILMLADTADTNAQIFLNDLNTRNQQAEENEKLVQSIAELKEQSEKTNEFLYHIYLNTQKEDSIQD